MNRKRLSLRHEYVLQGAYGSNARASVISRQKRPLSRLVRVIECVRGDASHRIHAQRQVAKERGTGCKYTPKYAKDATMCSLAAEGGKEN